MSLIPDYTTEPRPPSQEAKPPTGDDQLADLQAQIHAEREGLAKINAERRHLQWFLRQVRSRPTYEEVRESLHALELEHRQLWQRMALCIGQPPYEQSAEEQALDNQLKTSTEEANRKRRICEKLWEHALLSKPERTSKEEFWVS